MPSNADPRCWHPLPVDAALAALDTNAHGLSQAEAEARLGRHGPSQLARQGRSGLVERFLQRFRNVLIYILAASAVGALALGEVVEALVIGGVVLVDAVVGFLQEGKTERALDAIHNMIAPNATVIRDGHRTTLPAAGLVPGDVVVQEAGDRVPADVICSDKTGTLTRNEMTVQAVVTADATYTVSGAGHVPHGAFLAADQEIDVAAAPQRNPVRRPTPLHGHGPPHARRRRVRARQGIPGAPAGDVRPAAHARGRRAAGRGVLACAHGCARPEVARTMVVNVMVVLEILYLFGIRYAHGTSLTFRGVLGTPGC